MRYCLIVIFIICITGNLNAYCRLSAASANSSSDKVCSSIASNDSINPGKPAFPLTDKALHSRFVDSVYRKMGRRKRIAQLFIIPAYSNQSLRFQDSIAHLIKKYQPGGIIFFQGSPKKQLILENRYQDLLKTKSLIAMDGEWGLGMRLDSTISFPYQMSLGAIQDNTLIKKMGSQIAIDFRRMNMQINFAPDIDINNNPDNSVINFRSFGEIRDNVASKGLAYVQGLQADNILATIKHFPGHGDTNIDSHLDLPFLPFSRNRLDSLELYPFRKLISSGAGAVMIAHMHVSSIDSAKSVPTTLSKLAVSGLLKKDMHFSGLIITDAMNMLGLAKYYSPEQAAILALQAGNDMVEMSPDLPAALKAVRKAVRKKEILKSDIELKCRKVLAYKEWAGLDHYMPGDTTNLIRDLNRKSASELLQTLSDSSLTVLRQNGQLLKAFRSSKKAVLLEVGVTGETLFSDSLNSAMNTLVLRLPKGADQKSVDSIRNQLGKFDIILLAIHDQRLRPGAKLTFSKPLLNLVSDLAGHDRSMVIFFTNAYVLAQINSLDKAPLLILTYQDSKPAELSAFKYLMGRQQSRGKLPVSVGTIFKAGDGLPLH